MSGPKEGVEEWFVCFKDHVADGDENGESCER